MRVFNLRAIPIVLAFALLAAVSFAYGLPGGASAQAPPAATNAWFQADGGERIALSADSIGDTIAQHTLKPDGTCDGSGRITMNGNVERVRITIHEDCSVTLAHVIPDTKWAELMASMDEELARSAANAAFGWKWEVREPTPNFKGCTLSTKC